MTDIEKVKEGDILITEESRFGQQYFLYGPVVLIERKTNEVGIKTMEGNRLFPVAKLWTIPAFINNRRVGGGQRRPSSGYEARVLAGFIATLLEEGAGQNGNDILEEIRKKNIKPTRTQEVLEVLMNV